MLPLILESKKIEDRDAYVGTFMSKHNISPYNLQQYEPENKEFSIKQIREIINEASFQTKESRLFHLKDFDKASLEAQNAFLKTLEEHPANYYFILSVGNAGRLLPTIRSRSKVLKLAHVTSKKQSTNLHAQLESIIKGETKTIFSFFSGGNLKTNVEQIFDEMIQFFRGRLENDPHAPAIGKELIMQRSIHLHNHVDPQTALDKALLAIYRTYTKVKKN